MGGGVQELAYYQATKEQLPAVISNDKKRRPSEVCPLHVVCRQVTVVGSRLDGIWSSSKEAEI